MSDSKQKQYKIVKKVLTKEQKDELDAALREGLFSKKKIAEFYGIPVKTIYNYYSQLRTATEAVDL